MFSRHPALFEAVRKLANDVLGLRRRHAVTGHENHLPRVRELGGRVLEPDLAHLSRLRAGGLAGHAAEGAEQNVGDRTVQSQLFGRLLAIITGISGLVE